MRELGRGRGEARWLGAELRALVGLGARRAARRPERATAAWRRFLEAIASSGPLVLVFEDLHWADDGLLDFVDDLVDWLRTSRCSSSRRPAPSCWSGAGRGEAARRTRPLSRSSRSATTRPAADREPARARRAAGATQQPALLERAGGNPLFAEQFVRMLDRARDDAETAGVGAGRDRRPPRRPAARGEGLLQEAAVLGRSFWLGGARCDDRRGGRRRGAVCCTRSSARTSSGASAALDGREDAQYSFRHALLRDVAYGQIPRAARAEKHRQAAEWIEGLGRPDDHAELLAHHYGGARLGRAAGLADDPGLVERPRGRRYAPPPSAR